jgi:hypothetical protein
LIIGRGSLYGRTAALELVVKRVYLSSIDRICEKKAEQEADNHSCER